MASLRRAWTGLLLWCGGSGIFFDRPGVGSICIRLELGIVSFVTTGPSDRLVSLEQGEFHRLLSRIWGDLGGGIPDRGPRPWGSLDKVACVSERIKPEFGTDAVRASVSVQLEGRGQAGIGSLGGRDQIDEMFEESSGCQG